MPALDLTTSHYSTLMKRSGWPSHNRGVMVVFCIIGTLALVLIALFLHKKLAARKARREAEAFNAGNK